MLTFIDRSIRRTFTLLGCLTFVGLGMSLGLGAAGCGEAAPGGPPASASDCQQACDHTASLCGPASFDCVGFCVSEGAPQGGIACALGATSCDAARACYPGTLPDDNGGGATSGSTLATRDECQQACDHGAKLCGPMDYDCVQFCLDERAPKSGIACALAADNCGAAQACYGGELP